MKWVIIAIIACLVPYTWITLAFRKETPAYEPYQNSKDRAQVLRLLDAGFQRVELTLERLVEPSPLLADSNATAPLPGGVPPLLRDVLLDQPPVSSNFSRIDAPASAWAGAPYIVNFSCTQPAKDERAETAVLYLRAHEAVFLIGYHELSGEIQSRRLESLARVIVPAHTFASGSYQATLIGALESQRWTFTVH
ncbi:MAG: hypothetical protein J6386_14425 [Candidatus Synoicihabitans palmerolidicus]|nr:hypothetical protein [Candidatus Synoicihabitans palmerolidicus]